MPGEYASNTTVPVSRSRDEIENTLARFGATGFAYFNQMPKVAIAFEIRGIRVVMNMTMPAREQFELDSRGKLRTASAIDKDHEQACRQRWRTLANAIKAKLAMVDDGISTIEREFLADIVTPNGETVGDRLIPQLEEISRGGMLPSLMPGSSLMAIEQRTN
jgi:hypothetical protein